MNNRYITIAIALLGTVSCGKESREGPMASAGFDAVAETTPSLAPGEYFVCSAGTMTSHKDTAGTDVTGSHLAVGDTVIIEPLGMITDVQFKKKEPATTKVLHMLENAGSLQSVQGFEHKEEPSGADVDVLHAVVIQKAKPATTPSTCDKPNVIEIRMCTKVPNGSGGTKFQCTKSNQPHFGHVHAQP